MGTMGIDGYTVEEDMKLNDEDIIVVVQGDEPLVTPDMISSSIKPLIQYSDVNVSN